MPTSHCNEIILLIIAKSSAKPNTLQKWTVLPSELDKSRKALSCVFLPFGLPITVLMTTFDNSNIKLLVA